MSEMKPCPYCAEQVLAVAVKCKHCGSNIGSSSRVVKNQFMMRPAFSVMFGVLLLIAFAVVLNNWNRTGTLSGRGYSDADVANIEQSIRTEFSKRDGAKVEEVKMIRESPTKMAGFATLRVPLLGEVHKSCSATMGENGQSIWRCN